MKRFCKKVNVRYFVLAISIASGSLAWPQAASGPADRSPLAGSETPSEYLLGPGDQIKIWVRGLEEASEKSVRIGPSGDLDLPVAGQIHAAGLTTEQLRSKLVERFAKELLHPEVSVEIIDFGSQPVSVMGAVNRPGVHQLHGHKTLGEVLSLAEGLRPDAGSRITITREIKNGQIPLPTAALDPTGEFSVAAVNVRQLLAGERPADNIQIYPRDLITVPSAEVVYVVGEVKRPGEVLLKDRDTISALQALAEAEGLGPTPAPQSAKIMRLVPGQAGRTEIPVNLSKVQEGKAEDIAMRPNDILVIPPSGPKKAALRATEAAIQTVTGVIIWRRP